MKLNSLLMFLLLFSSLFIQFTQAQISGVKKYHPLSSKLAFSFEGGPTISLSDFNDPKVSFYGRFTSEYLFPSRQIGVWGLKGHAAFGYIEGSGGATSSRPELTAFKTTFLSLGGGVEYLLKLSDVVLPYAYAGAAYLYFDPRDPDGNLLMRNSERRYSRHEWMLMGEGGFKFLVSENVSLNFGLNMNYVNMDNLDDVIAGADNDIFFTAFSGVTFYILGISDNDGDGVTDDEDVCPETPAGVIVDNFGCPVDTDKDGVPDYLDTCPGTPANISVDKNGCPVDSDGDGIPDYMDLCKDTPEGVAVDKRGCALDEDQDGVPDYKDKCPGTPIGLEVNKSGCPPAELKKEIPEIIEMTLSSGVNFEIGKSTLLPGAKFELDKMIKVMNNSPKSMWQITGHTDNTGSRSMNINLSYDRAQSVANYLVQNGIDRSRLIVKGLGPDYSIADNGTETGRAQNRRVAIKFVEAEAEVIDLPYDVRSSTDKYNADDERHVGNMIFTDGNQYCFQVSSYRTRKRAERDAQKFRNMGYDVFVVEANLPSLDGIWYRVRIGYFDSLSEARQKRSEIIK